MNAEQLVARLLEAGEDVDWSPEPGDPDAPHAQAFDAVAQSLSADDLRKALRRAFRGAFQQPEFYESDYFTVETRFGDYVIPADVVDPGPVPPKPDDEEDPAYAAYLEYLNEFSDYVENEPESVERRHGFVYRTSAPGYMDSSPWEAAETEDEAIQALIDGYDGAFDPDNLEDADPEEE